jgi:MFS family permease
VGLTGELYRPACSALLADLTPPGQRITAFATYRVAFNAGFAVGPAMAGFLAAHGFFWLFVGDAITSLLFGLVAWFAVPQGVRSGQRDATWTEALQVLRHDRRLHQVLLANLAIGLVFFQIASTFSLHVTQLGFSTAVYGAIFSLNGALVMLCELPLTTITRRFPARRVMALGYLLVGIGFVLNAFAYGIPALVMCMVIFTFGEMLTMPVSAAFVADLAPANMRGRYLGASGLTWATALIIGPGLGMKLYAFSTLIYWLACGGLGVLAAAVILVRPKPQPVPEGLIVKAGP